MNTRREGIDILTQSRYNTKTNDHDTFWHHLQESQNLTYIFVTAVFIIFILNHFRSVPAAVVGAVWDILVYSTPSRIVVALDSKGTKDTIEGSSSMTFQAKSEAMQRILGLDNASFSSFFPRARSISGISTALLGNKDAIPPGLGNWDNSCYQNSIIQGLASLTSFAEYLERNIDRLGGKVSFSTHEALRGIIERLNNGENHGQRLWTPPDLKSMSSWQQQDAQEYFAKVVDQIDHEVQQATRRQTRNLGLKMAGPHEHVIGAAGQELSDGHGRTESQSPRNPLEGLLAQRVGCMQCGWTEGLSLIPFNCLTVPLGTSYEYDVRDCLDHYMNLEPIEGVECAKCTLLRAQDQLRNLLQQIEDDKKLSETNDSPKLSDALKSSAEERLKAVEEALEETDFTEKTLSKKCHIPSKNRVSTTKSRQAVIARPPKCFVVHINRSVFDEHTGLLRKNYAAVKFPKVLDMSEWCLGGNQEAIEQSVENWGTDPRVSMLPPPGAVGDGPRRRYELRAVVTHYGRHENGHYICYRKHPVDIFPAHVPEAVLAADGEKEKSERWYRLSDEDVQMVSEENVMAQGGAFMLFYEAVDTSIPGTRVSDTDFANQVSSCPSSSPEDMSSITSTATDRSTASDTSRATSVSAEADFSDKGQHSLEPPKKRSAPSAASTTVTPKKARQSKLAKENDISGEEEAEIKEVFHIFAEPNDDFPQEKEGVIPREDVRKALVALGLPPADSKELQSILSAIDPTATGYVPYGPFLSIAAAKLRSRSDEAMSEEVDAAFRLFTRGTDGPITLGHLRRIARELKEDSVSDVLLRDMILEANGGGSVERGVNLEEFREIMLRAGVF
ncbi:hypothetical protein BJX61DRAFT_540013 [Aspergillus egyptiacus]|nr:hypothetical protein BJX61DRAFT_540013 [Aspergillus egyptiacus]